MRKIDKTEILATEYKKWEEDFENNQQPHKKYSSDNKYYNHVVMNLLFCQNGLCAYTERQLCPPEFLDKSNWENGKYIFNGKKWEGTIDHFDATLKSKKKDSEGKKDWLWDNLFFVHTDINRNKAEKEVDNILKPDSPEYDVFKLLDYDFETHYYISNHSLEETIRKRINYMLDILGINSPNVVDRRKNIVEKAIKLNCKHLENEFPTAFQFYERI